MDNTRTAEITAAREADTLIADEWEKFWKANAHAVATQKKIERYTRMQKSHLQRNDSKMVSYCEDTINKFKEELKPQLVKSEEARTASRDLDAKLYTGWTRFFLVKHIHSSQSCTTLRPTTRVVWLPSVSGLTEVEAVAEHGAILCTICYPTASVEWTGGHRAGVCAGAGQRITSDMEGRRGYHYGNTVACPVCGLVKGISRNGRIVPKHED